MPVDAVAFSPRRLRTAARAGNLAEVRARIEKDGYSVDSLAVPRTGASLLLAATQAGHPSVVAWLLAKGADADLARDDGTTPLLAACSKGHDACVAALIAAGANVNRSKQSGTSPLTIAAQHGYFSIVERLLEAGADVDQAATRGFSALYKAAQQGHVPTAAALLAAGADVNRPAPDGSTPLLAAAYIGNGLMVRELADFRGKNRVEVTRACAAPDGRKFTAVQAAKASGHDEVVSILKLAELAPLMGAMQRLAWASSGHRRLGRSSYGYAISADMLISVGLVTDIPVTATVERWEDHAQQDSMPASTADENDDALVGEEEFDCSTPPRRVNAPLLFGKYEKASPRPIPLPDTLSALPSRSGSTDQERSSPFPWDVNDEGGILFSSPGSVDYSSACSSSEGESESEGEEAARCSELPAHSPRQIVDLEVLRGKDCPDFVNRSQKEYYLSEPNFRRVFKLTRQGFYGLPKRMQENAKRQAGLSDRVDAIHNNDMETHPNSSSGTNVMDECQVRWWSDQLVRKAAASGQGEEIDGPTRTEADGSGSPNARQPYISPLRDCRRWRSSRDSGRSNTKRNSSTSSGYQSPFRRVAGQRSSIFRTASSKLIDEAQSGPGEEVMQHQQGTTTQTRDIPAFARQLFIDDDGDEDGSTVKATTDVTANTEERVVLEPEVASSCALSLLSGCPSTAEQRASDALSPMVSPENSRAAQPAPLPVPKLLSDDTESPSQSEWLQEGQLQLNRESRPDPDPDPTLALALAAGGTPLQLPPPLLPAVVEDAALVHTDSSVENLTLIKIATEAAAKQVFQEVIVERQVDDPLIASATVCGERDAETMKMSFKRFTSWFEEKHATSGPSVWMAAAELQLCQRIWREVSDASNQVDLDGLQIILQKLLVEGAISINHSGKIVPLLDSE
ncbi:ankyrin repeat domain-containing protein [bacterium]|nr:ankyrin repeat domain-containing protein [bacterium]